MKLFIWVDPYKVPYGTSWVHVVAETVEQARELANSDDAIAVTFGKFRQEVVPKYELGDPDHILDLPCAIWDEARD